MVGLRPEEESRILALFGKSSLRPGQRELVEAALSGLSALGVLPTGYGKSLCYQAAAVLLGGTSVVVSPLLALMREQADFLQRIRVPAARWDSSLSPAERENVLSQLESGSLRLLLVAPESLENPELLATLRQISLSLFVVDEAHCVSAWGHSFRPDYLKLPRWYTSLPFRSVMALTATAAPRVREDLCHSFGIATEQVVMLPPYRENITRLSQSVPDRMKALQHFLADSGHCPAVVYVRTRKRAEEVAGILLQSGISAVCYHAGMPVGLRGKLQDDFLHNRVDVLVATIAFGMGIDKSDVRSVVHWDAPSSPESYLQESGRAGRDGRPAWSLVLLDGHDLQEARNRIIGSEPDEEGVLRCVRWMLPVGRRVVSLWELETSCDVPEEVPLRTLSLLQESGAVEVVCRGYKYYQVRRLVSLKSVLDGRNQDEIIRLQWLDAHPEGEVEAAADAWGCSYPEAMAYLGECGASGEWKLGWRQQALYIRSTGMADAREVAACLSGAYAQRREGELKRFETVVDMLSSKRCINESLGEYFTGASGEACGHCSACTGESPVCPAAPVIPMPEWENSEMPDLSRPGQRRRFLLGIPSPGLLARRLWAHPLYGCCRGVRWEELP